MSKNQEYSNLLHTYCDVDHAQDLSESLSVTSADNLLNVTIIDWCANKQSETYRISSNEETRAMYTGVLYKKCIRKLFR